MDGVEGVVPPHERSSWGPRIDVERDPTRDLPETVAVEPDHGLAHAQQVAWPWQVLQARDGWLRAERGAIGQAAEGKLEGRVMAQAVGVVAVLVARGNHQHSKAQDVGQAVDDAFRCPRIGDTGGQAIGDTQAAFDLTQRKHATI